MKLEDAFNEMWNSPNIMGMWRPETNYLIYRDFHFDPDGLSFLWTKDYKSPKEGFDPHMLVAGVGKGVQLFSVSDLLSSDWLILKLSSEEVEKKFEPLKLAS